MGFAHWAGLLNNNYMKIKRILGYTLLTTLAFGYIRVVIFSSPWWVIPLGLTVGVIFLAIAGLIVWLIKSDAKPTPLTEQKLIDLGFKKIPHFTVMNSLIYDLGMNRSLSIGCVGTPNEMLWLREGDGTNTDDLISLHNFDYDGILTAEKLEDLLDWFES